MGRTHGPNAILLWLASIMWASKFLRLATVLGMLPTTIAHIIHSWNSCTGKQNSHHSQKEHFSQCHGAQVNKSIRWDARALGFLRTSHTCQVLLSWAHEGAWHHQGMDVSWCVCTHTHTHMRCFKWMHFLDASSTSCFSVSFWSSWALVCLLVVGISNNDGTIPWSLGMWCAQVELCLHSNVTVGVTVCAVISIFDLSHVQSSRESHLIDKICFDPWILLPHGLEADGILISWNFESLSFFSSLSLFSSISVQKALEFSSRVMRLKHAKSRQGGETARPISYNKFATTDDRWWQPLGGLVTVTIWQKTY